jgi:hypothetical protein
MEVKIKKGELKSRLFTNTPRDVKKLFMEEVVGSIRTRK